MSKISAKKKAPATKKGKKTATPGGAATKKASSKKKSVAKKKTTIAPAKKRVAAKKSAQREPRKSPRAKASVQPTSEELSSVISAVMIEPVETEVSADSDTPGTSTLADNGLHESVTPIAPADSQIPVENPINKSDIIVDRIEIHLPVDEKNRYSETAIEETGPVDVIPADACNGADLSLISNRSTVVGIDWNELEKERGVINHAAIDRLKSIVADITAEGDRVILFPLCGNKPPWWDANGGWLDSDNRASYLRTFGIILNSPGLKVDLVLTMDRPGEAIGNFFTESDSRAGWRQYIGALQSLKFQFDVHISAIQLIRSIAANGENRAMQTVCLIPHRNIAPWRSENRADRERSESLRRLLIANWEKSVRTGYWEGKPDKAYPEIGNSSNISDLYVSFNEPDLIARFNISRPGRIFTSTQKTQSRNEGVETSASATIAEGPRFDNGICYYEIQWDQNAASIWKRTETTGNPFSDSSTKTSLSASIESMAQNATNVRGDSQ